MSITPIMLGRGRSGHAIAKCLASLPLLVPELKIGAPVWLERGTSLSAAKRGHAHPILIIANPHGLHAEAIAEADAAGYEAILCEKPACVNLDQLAALRSVTIPTAVFHVYRQMWGVQALKQMLEAGRFGELISIEGRYWQASTAERALLKSQGETPKSWKDDPRLSGLFDTFLDVGSHWVDAASFLYGAPPVHIKGWRPYLNADSPHRDSHVQLSLEFPQGGRGFASISKNVHGASNHFEINIIGSRASATWQFLQADEILLGEGRDRRIITRKDTELGFQQPPFHGAGWLEGYMEIAKRLLAEVYLKQTSRYPGLKENLQLLEVMLQTQWT